MDLYGNLPPTKDAQATNAVKSGTTSQGAPVAAWSVAKQSLLPAHLKRKLGQAAAPAKAASAAVVQHFQNDQDETVEQPAKVAKVDHGSAATSVGRVQSFPSNTAKDGTAPSSLPPASFALASTVQRLGSFPESNTVTAAAPAAHAPATQHGAPGAGSAPVKNQLQDDANAIPVPQFNMNDGNFGDWGGGWVGTAEIHGYDRRAGGRGGQANRRMSAFDMQREYDPFRPNDYSEELASRRLQREERRSARAVDRARRKADKAALKQELLASAGAFGGARGAKAAAAGSTEQSYGPPGLSKGAALLAALGPPGAAAGSSSRGSEFVGGSSGASPLGASIGAGLGLGMTTEGSKPWTISGVVSSTPAGSSMPPPAAAGRGRGVDNRPAWMKAGDGAGAGVPAGAAAAPTGPIGPQVGPADAPSAASFGPGAVGQFADAGVSLGPSASMGGLGQHGGPQAAGAGWGAPVAFGGSGAAPKPPGGGGGNIGLKLMAKMGFDPSSGRGLGKDGTGITAPLEHVKTGRSMGIIRAPPTYTSSLSVGAAAAGGSAGASAGPPVTTTKPGRVLLLRNLVDITHAGKGKGQRAASDASRGDTGGAGAGLGASGPPGGPATTHDLDPLSDEALDQLHDDVQEECMEAYGPVEQVFVYTVATDGNGASSNAGPAGAGQSGRWGGVPPTEVVRVFVQFQALEHALKAQAALDGRFFGGRRISAAFFDEDRFARLDLAPTTGELQHASQALPGQGPR